jgi:hypothetical protein
MFSARCILLRGSVTAGYCFQGGWLTLGRKQTKQSLRILSIVKIQLLTKCKEMMKLRQLENSEY